MALRSGEIAAVVICSILAIGLIAFIIFMSCKASSRNLNGYGSYNHHTHHTVHTTNARPPVVIVPGQVPCNSRPAAVVMAPVNNGVHHNNVGNLGCIAGGGNVVAGQPSGNIAPNVHHHVQSVFGDCSSQRYSGSTSSLSRPSGYHAQPVHHNNESSSRSSGNSGFFGVHHGMNNHRPSSSMTYKASSYRPSGPSAFMNHHTMGSGFRSGAHNTGMHHVTRK